ncbi:penicillin-binding protein 2 [Homoserinimonas sp. OAct 916]|uniref:peptidoglycan D,D-transpeptidase FtsI family protein n=1 Tax=Homoserinimonas sp. OAct 916 TaxID=2211450 RepID=UPI000DBE7CF3|nr:penicillin-binding transpeptidase domain-containing protein [Homoserinimonas sp. OAct 916]
MNRELKRVSIVVLLMFVALMTSTSIIQVFQADNLQADARNTRAVIEAYSAKRGPILVEGEAVALSKPIDDMYKFIRVYTDGQLYAPATGYYTIGQGSTGIENALNAELTGTANSQFFEKLNSIITGQIPQGAAVELTLDRVAQQAAWDALGDLQGAVIVTEPKTGRILAMVSKPSFDPNELAVHKTSTIIENYDALIADPADPLYNRAIAGNLNPPGSVFKLVVASAAFQSGKFTPDSQFPNPASFTLPGSTAVIYNSGRGTCGDGATVSIADAVRLSCNIPMAELGIALGSRAILDEAEKYGFNKELQVPLDVTPSTYEYTTDKAQVALSAFGQGSDRATPLQMAMVTAGIANGGTVMKPNLVDSILSPDLRVLDSFSPEVYSDAISPTTARQLTEIMVSGVENGAASNARIDGVSVAGKTGTAENGPDDPYTLWFTGFAPANNPEFAITVLIENGGGMGQEGYGNLLAAPIAKQVLEAVLNK